MKRAFIRKNCKMLSTLHKKHGFMCWRHVFSGLNLKTGDRKSFFIEFFIINPSRSPQEPVFGQLYEQKIKKYCPSYIILPFAACFYPALYCWRCRERRSERNSEDRGCNSNARWGISGLKTQAVRFACAQFFRDGENFCERFGLGRKLLREHAATGG